MFELIGPGRHKQPDGEATQFQRQDHRNPRLTYQEKARPSFHAQTEPARDTPGNRTGKLTRTRSKRLLTGVNSRFETADSLFLVFTQ